MFALISQEPLALVCIRIFSHSAMKTLQLKLFIAFFTFYSFVSALPGLSARQCDGDVCPWDWVDNALWGLVGGAGLVYNSLTGLLEPTPSPQTPSTPNKNTAPPSADPALELWVVEPADTDNKCDIPSTSSPNIDSSQVSYRFRSTTIGSRGNINSWRSSVETNECQAM